jgi:hypothetical protein
VCLCLGWSVRKLGTSSRSSSGDITRGIFNIVKSKCTQLVAAGHGDGVTGCTRVSMLKPCIPYLESASGLVIGEVVTWRLKSCFCIPSAVKSRRAAVYLGTVPYIASDVPVNVSPKDTP